MPRGRTKEPKTIDELNAAIQKVEETIEVRQNEIKALKAQKAKYSKALVEAEKDILVEAVKKSGKTVKEAIEIITKK